MVLKLISDLSVVCRNCYEYSRSDSVYVLNYTVLVEDSAVFLQLEDLVELLNALCSRSCCRTVSADYVRNKTCVVAHSSHLYHCLCAVLESAEHSWAHLASCSLFEYCVRIALIVELVVLALAHNFYVEAHSLCEAVELHDSARLVSGRTCVDYAVILSELVEVRSDNNVCLNVEHYYMLAVLHSVCSNLSAYIRNSCAVDNSVNAFCCGNEGCVAACNILAGCDACVCLFESVCNNDLIVSNLCILESLYRKIYVDIGYDSRCHSLHENHLCNHATAHLSCAYDTDLDDLAFFFSLLEFPVHIKHNSNPP